MGTTALIVVIIVGLPIAVLMGLRLITAVGALMGRLAGDDRFHEVSKERDPTNAHITVYWKFRTGEERFAELERVGKQRFIEWVDTKPYVTLEEGIDSETLAVRGVPVDATISDPHNALLDAFGKHLATQLPVQFATFEGRTVVGLTFDHTMVSGLTFARCMAHTFGDPEDKGSRAFPLAWYAPVLSELALIWYLGRVAATFRGWNALPTHPAQAGVSPQTLFYDFNVEQLKASAVAEDASRRPSSLALIAAKTLRSLLRSMRGTLNRPLRIGFSVAFSHSKILHNNVGLIVIDIPADYADKSHSDIARLITRQVGREKLQAWHSNNFLKTIPKLPSTSYRKGVDVVFTAYPSPPADLFKPDELDSVRVEVRELTYPLYVNCISYLERCFVSLVVNTPAVDLSVLSDEHANSEGTGGDAALKVTPKDADSYRALLDI